MGDISISNGVRSNLTALQSTASMMEQTQNRLSTGKRVNSALDNPANFFTASAMDNRASDLGSLLDSMKTGVNTIKAADNALSSITKLVESAQGTARQALQDATGEKEATVVGETGLGTTPATTKSGAEAKTLVGDIGFDVDDALTFTTTKDGVATSTTLTLTATTTAKDLVDQVNTGLAGKAEAEITSDGKLSITAKDGATLDIAIADDAGGSADTLQLLFGATATVNGTAAQSIDADQAQQFTPPTAENNETREKLAEQFNDILGQITDLAEDADFNGINLLQGDDLKVTFNEKGGSKENSITIKGVDLDASGLGLTTVTNKFQSDADINASLDEIKESLTTLRQQASEFGSNLSTVETRQDFTTAMVNTLEQGASDLTLADVNKEGANMLALQTSQQLATTTMGMASRADQAVLSFLR
jgi:flagellin-like hook-associated protein FlgL